MKLFNKTAFFVFTCFLIIAVSGCKKILDEQNRSQILPDYFKTDGGVEAVQ